MTTGTVRWINESKGFGLITPDAGGKDLFARFWSFPAGDKAKSVKQKQKVSFDLLPSLDGDQAVNIKVLST
jgi:CspA family cold shock protein